ncbi:phage tail tape measure protein [Clostridium sp. Ade.TY]|uniref:phage tail tape measure protein n=1 Tax=Clostridium sp. Ade.TY TaxID=1391647 RepID=UPI0003FEE8F3|nr:phage tail tape measure protein [Clostridium sp. Ade.TY]
MAEIYNASGSVNIDGSRAVATFDKIEDKSKSFENNMHNTNQTTDNTGGHFTGLGNKMNNVADRMGETGKKMSLGVTVPLVALGKKIYDVGATFDSKMRRVQAVAGATTPQLKQLTDQAMDLGAKTIFSASQVADGMENLASAGLNTNQIIEAMPGVLDGAAASGEDLASTCAIVTGAMNSFGFAAKDTGHISDVMAKSANDTNASVASLGESLKYCGTPAHVAKQSFEEVTAALGVMANRQIMGSQAGTTLRGMFTRLSNPSREATKAMKEYGFNAYDAHGKMLPLNKIIDNLSKSTANLTDKQKQQFIAQVFGQEAMSGTMALMAEGGESIRKLTKGYKECNGEAKRTADIANKGVKASVENMKGSLENAAISIIQNCAPAISFFADKLGALAEAFGNLPPGVQQFIAGSLAILAVVGPVLIILSKLITSVTVVGGAFLRLPGNIKKGITKIKDFATATKNGTNVLGKFGGKISNVTKSLTKFASNSIKKATKSITDFSKKILNCIKSLAKFTLAIIKNTAVALKNGAVWVAQKVKLLAFKAAQLAVTGATKAMTLAQKALNLAMRMNPIGLVITILLALGAVFVTLYNKCEWFRNGVNAVWSFITNLFKKFSDFLTGVFTTDWTKSFGVFGNIINAFMHNMSNIFGAIKRIFGGLIDFITGVFTGNWSQAWQGVVNIFGGIMDGLGAVIKAPLNAVIGLINGAIGGINSLSVDIPSWVPVFGGQHFGVNLPTLNYLYNGGIFTQPTLLGGGNVVGDKFKGTGSNAEAVIPLNVLWSKLDAIANRPIIVKINERELITIIAEKDKEIDKMKKQLGLA